MSLDDNIVNCNVHHGYKIFQPGQDLTFTMLTLKKPTDFVSWGHGSLQTIHLASTHMVTFPYMALVPTLQLCAC